MTLVEAYFIGHFASSIMPFFEGMNAGLAKDDPDRLSADFALSSPCKRMVPRFIMGWNTHCYSFRYKAGYVAFL